MPCLIAVPAAFPPRTTAALISLVLVVIIGGLVINYDRSATSPEKFKINHNNAMHLKHTAVPHLLELLYDGTYSSKSSDESEEYDCGRLRLPALLLALFILLFPYLSYEYSASRPPPEL